MSCHRRLAAGEYTAARRTDRGEELTQHTQLTIDTDIAAYFADPHGPRQRGTNENTNGLLRQCFPKEQTYRDGRP